MVVVGLTERVAGLAAMALMTNPSDHVRLQGGAPVRNAWMPSAAPAQIVPEPVTVALGSPPEIAIPLLACADVQPDAFVSVTIRTTVPDGPAVNVMLAPEEAEVIVPLLMVQA